jgi:23S rRNA (pseudouridine1915-N3)-methyltransferase
LPGKVISIVELKYDASNFEFPDRIVAAIFSDIPGNSFDLANKGMCHTWLTNMKSKKIFSFMRLITSSTNIQQSNQIGEKSDNQIRVELHCYHYLCLSNVNKPLLIMQFTIIMVGKTSASYVTEGVELFTSRFRHYHPLRLIIIPDLKDRKNLTPDQIKAKEADAIKKSLPKMAVIVLLDEKGKEFRSLDFAALIQKQFKSGSKELAFIIGGAYGVSESVLKSANYKISLSKMTFTHQFIRLMITEQLYRAMTILKNEPYHNE